MQTQIERFLFLSCNFLKNYNLQFAPKPYGFGYEAPDEMGNTHFRQEQGDASGNVQGSYGYRDQQGLYRQVQYMANEGGFKASIKTNEPGVDDKENPADVSIYAQPPPAGIQEKYSQSSGYGMGGYGKFLRNTLF